MISFIQICTGNISYEFIMVPIIDHSPLSSGAHQAFFIWGVGVGGDDPEATYDLCLI